MNYQHISERESRASKPFMKLVRNICPQAPAIGERSKVYMGITRDAKNTIVGGADDVPRACRVVGYSISIADSTGVHPRNNDTIQLHAKVRLASKADGISSAVVHISCLWNCCDVQK